ncbi:unnamed protein product [Merluccius merluccius]
MTSHSAAETVAIEKTAAVITLQKEGPGHATKCKAEGLRLQTQSIPLHHMQRAEKRSTHIHHQALVDASVSPGVSLTCP